MSEFSKTMRKWERLGDNAPRWRDILTLCDEVDALEAAAENCRHFDDCPCTEFHGHKRTRDKCRCRAKAKGAS